MCLFAMTKQNFNQRRKLNLKLKAFRLLFEFFFLYFSLKRKIEYEKL